MDKDKSKTNHYTVVVYHNIWTTYFIVHSITCEKTIYILRNQPLPEIRHNDWIEMAKICDIASFLSIFIYYICIELYFSFDELILEA